MVGGKNKHALLILTLIREYFLLLFSITFFVIFKLNEEFASTGCTMDTLTYLFQASLFLAPSLSHSIAAYVCGKINFSSIFKRFNLLHIISSSLYKYLPAYSHGIGRFTTFGVASRPIRLHFFSISIQFKKAA